jgi:hypothetical protein
MKAVKVIAAASGLIILLIGLVFLIGGRPAAGGVMIVAGAFLVVVGLRKPTTRDVIIRRELELTGNVSLESMKCSRCGGALSSESVSVRAGTVFVTCPYCHGEYQIEEAPKW